MAGLVRVPTLLRAFTCRTGAFSTNGLHKQLPWQLEHSRAFSCRYRSTSASSPILSVQPESSLCDEVVNIEASGLTSGQEVTLKAQVYTENGKYKFESKAHYKADADGRIKVVNDPSLGGSYEGIEPMGLFLNLEPIPEVAHKYPRLVKWDVTKPFEYTLQLIKEVEGQEQVLTSTTFEKMFLADYVEQVPVKTGGAEGMLFLPKQRGSSDPLPFIIDMRGLLTNLVVDRAATLASHGFAVFAFDYFLPRRRQTQDDNVYMDSQSFLDVIDFAKAHPRLDENRIGMTCSCYGGAMMTHSVTRLNLPVKCMVGAGFVDVLSVRVGWKNLDGSLLEPVPVEVSMEKWTDENGKDWVTFNKNMSDWLEPGDSFGHGCVAENLECPFLIFLHKDDHHIPSYVSTNLMIDRLQKAGKGHLLQVEELAGTGHFLEVPYQPVNLVSSLFDPTKLQAPKMYYTYYGGKDTKLGVQNQQYAWRKIVNFFRKHLEVKEMYRSDWLSED